MSWLPLVVEGPGGRGPAEVRTDAAFGSQLHILAIRFGGSAPAGAAWFACDVDGARVDRAASLAEQGVPPGSILRIAPDVPAIRPEAPLGKAPTPTPPPSLPLRAPATVRLRSAAGAVLGTRVLDEARAAGPRGRLRAVRRWGDPRRRVEWVLSRCPLPRPVVVGVVAEQPAASARLAVELAGHLGAHRREGVVLVDGADPPGELASCAGGDDASFADVLEGRLPGAGPLVRARTAVVSPGGDPGQGRDVVATLLTLAGVVVVDCGTSSPLEAVCDQVVMLSSTLRDDTAPPLAEHPGIVRITPEGEATAPGWAEPIRAGTPLGSALLAAVLVARGWRDLPGQDWINPGAS